MARKLHHIVPRKTSRQLYTVDDVKRVNAARVGCCKSYSGIDHGLQKSAKSLYSAGALNSAWKKVKK